MTNWKWDYNSENNGNFSERINEGEIPSSPIPPRYFGILSNPNIVDDILNEQSYIIWAEWFKGMTLLDRVKVWEK